ncbi:MAG: hypothetical protein RBQ64_02935 [Candidatus Izemoplasmatales bacterium]|jgi:hypothetical protein|nr:hypothetical protein [Candidatus Izemoplasmatales bacterium]
MKKAIVFYSKTGNTLSVAERFKGFDLFITHQFPYAWMGGKQTLNQMKRIVETKKGSVRRMTSINWSNKKREEQIENMLKLY